MMKRSFVTGILLGLLVVGAFVSSAVAYTKITTDGNQPNQPVTAYDGITPPAGTDLNKPWSCRSKLPLDKRCYGAGGLELDIGHGAVHMINGQWNNPVAAFGSVVTLPKLVTLTRRGGSPWTSNLITVRDTGAGDEYSAYNAWLDIYCGDDWQDSPSYNWYTLDNITAVRNAFQNPASSRWNLYYDIK